MTIPRIYCPDAIENKEICELGPDNYKYLKQVLRLKPGSKIYVFDGFGHEFAAVIKSFSSGRVCVELGERISAAGKEIRISLAQAIPKANKMDLIVKSAAELGADVIIPFTAARSVSRITGDKALPKVARWQKIAREAARCCRGSQITEVLSPTSFANMLSQASDKSYKIIFWEEESQKSIKGALMDKKFNSLNDFFVIVGPEGGFSKDEVRLAKKAGFISVSLGRQILKVETAAAAIISIIQYEKGIFSNRSKEVNK
ncbi:MAG: RsmE family RNA methyltransferase [Smithellaceae bacterium]